MLISEMTLAVVLYACVTPVMVLLLMTPLIAWGWNKDRVIKQLQDKVENLQAKIEKLELELEKLMEK